MGTINTTARPIRLPTKPWPTNARFVRVANGWTIDAVALAAGLDASYLSRIERGLEQPSRPARRRLAAALGLDEGELLEKPTP